MIGWYVLYIILCFINGIVGTGIILYDWSRWLALVWLVMIPLAFVCGEHCGKGE